MAKRCPHFEVYNEDYYRPLGWCRLGIEFSSLTSGSCSVDNPAGPHWYRRACKYYRLPTPPDIKSRTREDIESDLGFAKSNHDSMWKEAMAAEKYTLETGRGHDERMKTYNFAKSMDETCRKRIEEFENELNRYDRNPAVYKRDAEQEQKRKIKNYNLHLEKIKSKEQSHEWEYLGKCRYDGGNFVGFFSKKCENCGRKK